MLRPTAMTSTAKTMGVKKRQGEKIAQSLQTVRGEM